jgi:putative restriction endonuclease
VEPEAADGARRAYATRLAMTRLHQAKFRQRVLKAYQRSCTVCRLGRDERLDGLIDAAHILPDRHERGEPVVRNGLALCKIHHAAFDMNIMGIRPDQVIEIRSDILLERDGPMLRHGLQELHGSRLAVIPRQPRDRPDPERLSERYEEFRSAN